jgi:4-hydroxy-tetrahydrodipicolinate synthase
LLDRYLDDRVHGVVVNGSSGEWFSQTREERLRVTEIAADQIAARATLIIGCSSLTSADAVAIAEHASECGADGVMFTAPPYMRPSNDEIVEYFRAVSEQVDLPVMVYNIPRRVGVEIDLDTATRLAALDRVVAFKDEVPFDTFAERLPVLVQESRIFGTHFMSPEGMSMLEQVGGDGYIGGWEVLGDRLPAFFEALWRGDHAEARRIGDRERAVDAALWDPGRNPRFGRSFQSQLKAALNLIGLPAGYPRPPLLPLADDELLRLRAVLETFDLPVVDPGLVRA